MMKIQQHYLIHYLTHWNKDIIHIKNILQSNIPAKNSPSKTKNPDELNVNPISQEKDLATAEKNDSILNDSMRHYVCNKCGKPFLTREDLSIHQDFESHQTCIHHFVTMLFYYII